MVEIVGYFSKDPMVAWSVVALIAVTICFAACWISLEYTRDQANLLVLTRLASEGVLINKHKVLLSVGGVPVLVRYFLHRDASSASEKLNIQLKVFVPGSIRLSLKYGLDRLEERLGLTTKGETGDLALDSVFCFAGKDIENFKSVFSSLEGKLLLKELFSKFDIFEINDGCCELTETPCEVMGDNGPEVIRCAAERLIKLVSLLHPESVVLNQSVFEEVKADLLEKEERRRVLMIAGVALLLGILLLNLFFRTDAVLTGSMLAGCVIFSFFLMSAPWQ